VGTETRVSTNREFFKRLKGPRARFRLCDLHVHSPASADVRIGDRFTALSREEKERIGSVQESLAGRAVDYEREMLKVFPVEEYYKMLLGRRTEVVHKEGIADYDNWAIVGVTDHNICEYAASLASHAWDRSRADHLVILPGIELDVAFPVEGHEEDVVAHIVALFAPKVSASDMRVAIREASGQEWSLGERLSTTSLPKFIGSIRCHNQYPAICIAAHVGSSRGVQKETKQGILSAVDAAIARTKGELANAEDERQKTELEGLLADLKSKQRDEDKIDLRVLSLIGLSGFDALQVNKKAEEVHYRRLHRFKKGLGRAVPIVSSDAHRVSDVFTCKNEMIPYLKIRGGTTPPAPTSFFNEVREKALRYGETRFSCSTPGYVTNWIAGVEISPDAGSASRFWPFESAQDGGEGKSFLLPLSRNLNCLIGGRGAGKSAAIEAVAFVAQPDDFDAERGKRSAPADWYGRADATLSGCRVRLCWRFAGRDRSSPRETSFFASRYFAPSGRFEKPKFTNLEDEEITAVQASCMSVQLFRFRDIEHMADDPDELRRLFDSICGCEIQDLETRIGEALAQLASQRSDMVVVASEIAELTEDGAPLRDYAKRLRDYEDANRPEVQAEYEKVDQAGSAKRASDGVSTDWGEICESLSIDERQSAIRKFFSDGLQTATKEDGDTPLPFCDSLVDALKGKSDAPVAPRERVTGAVDALKAELSGVSSAIDASSEAIEGALRSAKATLASKGLPVGGEDREAKRIDLEEADRCLKKYRVALSRWQKLREKRQVLFSKLKKDCNERTSLRKKTAIEITERLHEDLDPSLLKVEADAQPMADKSAFTKWLDDNVAPCVSKYRSERTRALVSKGVTPESLRELLLSSGDSEPALLVVDEARARDGRIVLEEAKSILEQCRGAYRLEQELTKEDVEESVWSRLPVEVRDGLWAFPARFRGDDTLNVEAVLELDELLFDDVPVIRLNDRPGDPGSRLRPLGELSPGQRCTAILPIVLMHGDAPLVIDQPEDNLDNRLIRQVVVNVLASIKLRRQVIMATHNPNMPVLGDVEQAVLLHAKEEKQCELQAHGDLDDSDVVGFVVTAMEGGREAFQYRQQIYQSHWEGPVAPD